MTGYDFTKSIFSFSAENPDVDAYHIVIFLYIGEISNECNWSRKIEISRKKLHLITGVKRDETYLKKIEDLEKWKAIKIIKTAKNQFMPYDVIEINERFLKNRKSLVNHREINSDVTETQRDHIYNKTIQPNNKKTNNLAMDIFFEKEDFKIFKNLNIEQQKLIKQNLKILFKKNFQLLSSTNLSQSNFEIKINRQIVQNFGKKEKKVIEDILSYFGIKEINNFLLNAKINRFVQYLSNNNHLDFFIDNFYFYKIYKKMTGQTQHGIERFIGTNQKKYEDGAWLSDNFKHKLKQFEESQRNTRNDKDRELNMEEGKKDVIRRLRNG